MCSRAACCAARYAAFGSTASVERYRYVGFTPDSGRRATTHRTDASATSGSQQVIYFARLRKCAKQCLSLFNLGKLLCRRKTFERRCKHGTRIGGATAGLIQFRQRQR